MKNYDSCLIIERMKESASKETDKFLLEIFGIAQNTLSGWKSRNSMPLQAIVTFADEYDVDLNWLILGKETKPALDEMEQLLLDNYKRLDSAQKLQLLNASLNGVGNGVNQVANGNNNNQQVFNRDVVEVAGIKK
ncbi:helix-turn-helix domain-containing protein [Ursidibacter arcticus]